MRDERLEVSVTFDERRGYVARADGLPAVTALSLAGVHKRINALLMPDDGVPLKLVLDRAARLERDRRRRGGASRPTDYARPR
jgi:hypothetical protein